MTEIWSEWQATPFITAKQENRKYTSSELWTTHQEKRNLDKMIFVIKYSPFPNVCVSIKAADKPF